MSRKNKMNFKELIQFGKARAFIMVYANTVAFLLIDLFHWKYWQYAMVFIPINFFINYFIYRKVFIKKEKDNMKIYSTHNGGCNMRFNCKNVNTELCNPIQDKYVRCSSYIK